MMFIQRYNKAVNFEMMAERERGGGESEDDERRRETSTDGVGKLRSFYSYTKYTNAEVLSLIYLE